MKNPHKALPAEWTGELLGKMHNRRVSARDIANELGVTPAYVSQIFNGDKTPPDAKERLNAAYEAIVSRREREKSWRN